jgi:hypothetical protein
MKSILRSIKVACAMLVVTLGLQSTASAATMTIEAMVPGYSAPVKVIPGSNTGGRVVKASNGTLFTDRVAKGEKCRYSGSPQAADFFPGGYALIGTSVYYGGYTTVLPWGTYNLPYTSPWFTISTNPAADNYMIEVLTYAGRADMRIPVGRR